VRKMMPPMLVSANALSKKIGVSQATLSKWLREMGHVATVDQRWPRATTKAGRSGHGRRSCGSMKLGDSEIGELLRREGLHEEQLQRWRADAEVGTWRGAEKGAKVEGGQANPRARAGAAAKGPRSGCRVAGARKIGGDDPGGRGRRQERGERLVTVELVNEAVAAGARRQRACEALGLTGRTVERWPSRRWIRDNRRGGIGEWRQRFCRSPMTNC
jgi:hypothetical protein